MPLADIEIIGSTEEWMECRWYAYVRFWNPHWSDAQPSMQLSQQNEQFLEYKHFLEDPFSAFLPPSACFGI